MQYRLDMVYQGEGGISSGVGATMAGHESCYISNCEPIVKPGSPEYPELATSVRLRRYLEEYYYCNP
jgi:hypothetical protein